MPTGAKIRRAKNAPHGSSLTSSITRPASRKPVLLYEYRDPGAKTSGLLAYWRTSASTSIGRWSCSFTNSSG